MKSKYSVVVIFSVLIALLLPWSAYATGDNGGTAGIPASRAAAFVSVKDFGAKGDGVSNDTAAIQAAINASINNCLEIPSGIYMIDAVAKLTVPSNTHILFHPGAELHAIANNSVSYRMLNIIGSNITIENPVLQGERTGHTGATGEWGHGIVVTDTAENIKIINPTVTDCWGDGIAIYGGKDIIINNYRANNNRRQGLTISNVSGFTLNGANISNTKGTPPQSGIDIEPDNNSDRLENIHLSDVTTKNNSGFGISINLNKFTDAKKTINILIENAKDNGSLAGSYYICSCHPTTGKLEGKIILDHVRSINSGQNGITVEDYEAANTPALQIIKPVITNPNAGNTGTPRYGSGICILRQIQSKHTGALGNISIIEPTIVDDRTNPLMVRAIYSIDDKGVGVAGACITDPLKLSGTTTGTADYLIDCNTPGWVVRDAHNAVTLTSTSRHNFTISMRAVSLVTNTGATDLTPFTLNQKYAIDAPITFVNATTFGLRITPGNGYNILPLSTTAGNYIQTTDLGASITLKRLNSTSYVIVNSSGSWTVQP